MHSYRLALASVALLLACSSSDPSPPPHIAVADLVNTTWQASLPVAIYDTVTAPRTCQTHFPLAIIDGGFSTLDTLLTGTEDVYTVCPGNDSVHWQWSGMGLIVIQAGDTLVLKRVNGSPFGWVLPRSEHKLSGTVDPNYDPRGSLVLTR